MTRLPMSADSDNHVADPPPFAATLPGIVAASIFGLACLVWLAAGERLPGGRWIVVHIFTLGVMTILIWTFSAHFATRATIAATPRPTPERWILTGLLAGGVVAMLVGRVSGAHLPLVLGSLAIMVVVGANVITLRRRRRNATSDQVIRVIQQYEHAHIAFLIAAGFGGALGAGWVPGALVLGAREAHIHLTVLGWGGLTVLATLTIYGPTLLGIPSDEGDTARSSSGPQIATLGMGVATAGFLLTSLARTILPDEGAGPAMLMTAGGLVAYGYGIVAVARPLLRATRGTDRSAAGFSVGAALTWFLLAIGLDITTIVTGLPGWAHGLATLLLVGVLAQLALAVLSHIAPAMRDPAPARSMRPGARIERAAQVRAVLFNLGVLLLAGGQIVGRVTDLPTSITVRLGWALIGVAVISHIGLLARPHRRAVAADETDDTRLREHGA